MIALQHAFRLNARPFASIQSGRKRYEVRLFDEKRQRLAVGDTIAFTRVPDGAGPLLAEVTDLRTYPSFQALYQKIPAADLDCEGWTMDELLSSTYGIYPRDEELKYGVVAIEIRVLKQ